MTRRAPKRRQAHNSKRTAVQQVLRQDFSLTKIELLCSEIAREFRPNRIVLFGSHAYGDSRPDSDIDLLVVMPFEGSPFRQAAAILGHLVSNRWHNPLGFARSYCPASTGENSDG